MMRSCGLLLLSVALSALMPIPAASAADGGIVVSPRKSSGEFVHYPRLTRFPDTAVQKQVNLLLARRDAQERQSHADCQKDLRENHQKMDKDSYFTQLEVTQVSRRFLSIAISGEYYCGGAHPDHGSMAPLTIDLSHGTEVTWATEFKPGVLGATDASAAHPGVLAAIYSKRYPQLRGNDSGDDCPKRIQDDPPHAFFISLSETEGGLVVEPEMEFVDQACADALTLKAGDLAPYVRDPNLAAELQAMAARK